MIKNKFSIKSDDDVLDIILIDEKGNENWLGHIFLNGELTINSNITNNTTHIQFKETKKNYRNKIIIQK